MKKGSLSNGLLFSAALKTCFVTCFLPVGALLLQQSETPLLLVLLRAADTEPVTLPETLSQTSIFRRAWNNIWLIKNKCFALALTHHQESLNSENFPFEDYGYRDCRLAVDPIHAD